MRDLAEMLHRTYFNDDVTMHIDDSVIRRFGPIVSEDLLMVRIVYFWDLES